MKRKMYKVVWDEEYCGNCHDELLANGFKTQKEAGEWAYEWAERKAHQLLPLGNRDEIEILANAKFRELSIMEYENDVPDKLVASLESYFVHKIEDAAESGLEDSKRSKSNGWGNPEAVEESISFHSELLKTVRKAQELGFKAKLVFEP